jgi:uncharacterized membrane protein
MLSTSSFTLTRLQTAVLHYLSLSCYYAVPSSKAVLAALLSSNMTDVHVKKNCPVSLVLCSSCNTGCFAATFTRCAARHCRALSTCMYITWVITSAFDSLYHVYNGAAAATADDATDVAAVQQLVWTAIFQLWDSGTKIGVLALGASCLEVYIPGTVQRLSNGFPTVSNVHL